MRILVDMDGVLADFDGGVIETYNRLHPRDVVAFPEKRTHRYISWEYPGEIRSELEGIIASPGFFRGLKPIPGAIGAVYEMKRRGDEVYFCTRPLLTNLFCMDEKRRWTLEYFGKEWVARVIPEMDKTRVPGDILIDDNPNADKGERIPTWEQILYTQPYNDHIEGKRRLTWTTNWRGVLYPAVNNS